MRAGGVKSAVDFLAAAQEWASKGYRVYPVEPLGRNPLNAEGIAGASLDKAQIERWWKEWPDANIGIAAGGGLAVLRVGHPHASSVLARAGLHRKALKALRTYSFRLAHYGRAYLFRTEKPVHTRFHVLVKRSGLKILGEGDGLLVPPSRLRSWRYRFPGGVACVPCRGSLAAWSQVALLLEGGAL